MKKILFFVGTLLMLGIVTVTVTALTKENTPSPSTEEGTMDQSSDIVVIDDEPVAPSTSVSLDAIQVGMKYEDFSALIESVDPLLENRHYFFQDESNALIVVKTDFKTVLAIKRISKNFADITDSEFDKITKGMTFFEVVELVGPPICQSPYSGINASIFATGDGQRYSVYWNDATVSSVRKYEDTTQEWVTKQTADVAKKSEKQTGWAELIPIEDLTDQN